MITSTTDVKIIRVIKSGKWSKLYSTVEYGDVWIPRNEVLRACDDREIYEDNIIAVSTKWFEHELLR